MIVFYEFLKWNPNFAKSTYSTLLFIKNEHQILLSLSLDLGNVQQHFHGISSFEYFIVANLYAKMTKVKSLRGRARHTGRQATKSKKMPYRL